MYTFELPMRSPICRFVAQNHHQELLLPHEMFSIMYHEYPSEFRSKFLGEANAITNFWANQAGSPLLVDHPLKTLPLWSERTIPLGVHGDGAPVAGLGKAWGKMLGLYCFFSFLTKDTTTNSIFYLYAAFAHLMTKSSMQGVWNILCWSFRALASGKWPRHDPHGSMYPRAALALQGQAKS